MRTSLAAIVAAAVLLAGLAGCGTKPGPDGASGPASDTAASAPVIAGPGQTLPGAAVPWAAVGPGWALVQGWAKQGKGAFATEDLYLVDPAGGKYTLFTWATVVPPGTLFDWSGDKQRALFGHFPSGRQGVRYHRQ